MATIPVRVLAVDDDVGARTALRELLKSENCEVQLAADGAEALERLAEVPPDIVVTDLDMPGWTAWSSSPGCTRATAICRSSS